ncbi:MAG: hypothetical protein K0S07_1123 [Chlamydiales bacterium]|nr:hypothetical protein [Chlamydiales bacterium]
MHEEPIEASQRERPLECGECKKTIAVCYSDATGKTISHLYMCSECPVLERKLHRLSSEELAEGHIGGSGLCCGSCGTTLEAVRTGSALGCPACYEIFGDFLVQELIQNESIPSNSSLKKSATLHIGRTPGQSTMINPSMRLIALNEALSDTLRREDYEQAAWIRDQIKALTGESYASGE